MTDEQSPQQEKLYHPGEVAQRLGVSVRVLGHMRRTGRIQGTFVGNTTVYTEEQINAARLERFKTGPRPGKRMQEGTGDDSSSVASIRKGRLLARSDSLLLAGA